MGHLARTQTSLFAIASTLDLSRDFVRFDWISIVTSVCSSPGSPATCLHEYFTLVLHLNSREFKKTQQQRKRC